MMMIRYTFPYFMKLHKVANCEDADN